MNHFAMKLLVVLSVVCCALPLQAQQTAPPMLSLHAASQPQTRATAMAIELVVLNPDTQPLSYDPPEELAATLQSEQRSWIVSLHPAKPAATLTIQGGQFVSIPYVLLLPSDASGRVVLDVPQVAALRVVVDIRDAEAHDESVAGSIVATIKQKEADAPPATSRIERSFASRYGFHEPIYFLYGNEAPAAKFQFSFKYRLIGENSKFGDLIPPFRGFYFAYTQRSLWDVGANSSPFYDTSYMPEMFFEWLAPDDKTAAGWFHWLGLQTGARHESNGKDGVDSRSLNIAYLRAGMSFGSLTGWQLVLGPRVFSYLSTAKENADIDHYRGHGELQLVLGKNDSFQLSVASRLGTGGKGSVQIDMTQPIRIPLINLETYLQLQYFDGYGESLRTYNQKSSVWRLGLAFVR